MKIATYNLLKGGAKRVHWEKMIDEQKVDLLCVQESHPQEVHLLPLFNLDRRSRSVWKAVESNRWGSGVYSTTGTVRPIEVPNYTGWVVGAELSNASWQSLNESMLVYSLHSPKGPGGYAGQVNRILDEIAKLSEGKQVIIAGDFNLSVSYWAGSERNTTRQDLAIQSRLVSEFGLINCWQSANPGLEPQQTLRWTGNRTIPFHIDGIFVPKTWLEQLQSCTILSGQEWDELSDHNPVIAEFS